jgi:LmbE family N-acetylglucosaminyl deacetylase
MRWIYISPHLDDAVLSCGGLIREQTSSKTPVEIWTICAGDPPSGSFSSFANFQHTQWGTGIDAYTLRRAEDIAACQIIGARYRHLPFLDCIYRQSKDGNWLYPNEESIFGVLSVEDAGTIYTLQTFLAAILKPDDVLVIPLTLGNHVDHQLVRNAAEGLRRPLLYYADAPYVIEYPEKIIDVTHNLNSQLYNFSLQDLVSWQEASQAYRSQLNVLFDGVEKMRSTIDQYFQKEKGIRLWRPDSD